MKVLVVNAGSSSLRLTLFRMTERHVLARALVERIGLADSVLRYETEDGTAAEEEAEVADHRDALQLMCRKLVDTECGVIQELTEVEAIGHRVVHGGERFTDPVLIDEDVKASVQQCASLAPLHNPPNLGGIEDLEDLAKQPNEYNQDGHSDNRSYDVAFLAYLWLDDIQHLVIAYLDLPSKNVLD